MESRELYNKLQNDFIKEGITDLNWAAKMPNLDKYLHNDFKQYGMGLMCDFTEKINKVFTTVFLSDKVLSKILSSNVTNSMIFSHHPTNWDIEYHNGNYAATEEYIAKLLDRKISIYVLHHPLDNYGEYSTCKTLAESINQMLNNNIRTLITGVTIANDYSKQTHSLEKENHINVLGGTHYSTEKFAPMKMCEYFGDLGLPSEFVEDNPKRFDL